MLRVEHEGGSIEVRAGQASSRAPGEWVRYSSPEPDGAEYVAVCLPAFSPTTVHRDVSGCLATVTAPSPAGQDHAPAHRRPAGADPGEARRGDPTAGRTNPTKCRAVFSGPPQPQVPHWHLDCLLGIGLSSVSLASTIGANRYSLVSRRTHAAHSGRDRGDCPRPIRVKTIPR